jgi:glycosyltransferase involved in cell wall biosynthesis
VRILFIVSAYPRHEGDVITPWLGESISALRRHGIDVEVLAPAFRGGPSHVDGGVRIHRFRYAPAPWETLSHDAPIPAQLREQPARFALVPGYLTSMTTTAMRLAVTGRYDVMHAFWPLPHAFPGMAAAHAAGVPLVSTFFGAELHWLPARHRWARMAVRAIVAESDATTAISNFTAQGLRAIAPTADPVVIPFGAAIGPRTTSVLDKLPYSATPTELLFVGRLVPRKGVDVLLRALARPVMNETRLTIVGDGGERQRLELLATSLEMTSRVSFAGLAPAADLDAHFRRCDALVLPAVHDPLSGTEGLGVVLIEALAYGKPVVASDIGGIPDVVRHGETGLLVPPGDGDALAAALRSLADYPARARAFGEAGRLDVADRFSWDRIASRLATLYHDVVARRQPAR